MLLKYQGCWAGTGSGREEPRDPLVRAHRIDEHGQPSAGEQSNSDFSQIEHQEHASLPSGVKIVVCEVRLLARRGWLRSFRPPLDEDSPKCRQALELPVETLAPW